MRNPWVQIAQEVFEVSAPELAIELDASEAEALSALVKLVPWALARCPDDAPPSENDLVEGASAARKIAHGVGWTRDPDAFCRVAATMRYPMLELMPGGIRIRGLDRYDGSWVDKQPHELRPAWRLFLKGTGPRPFVPAEVRRESGGNPSGLRRPDPDPDPDTDNKPPPPTSSSEGAPVEVKPVVVDVGKCWALVQGNRARRGLKPEGAKPPKGWATWCEARGLEGFTARDIASGHWEFLTDADFERKSWPTAVFMRNCWKTRVRHLGPEPQPPSPLQLELEERLKPLRAEGYAYAADQLRELVPVGLVGELLQLRARDTHYGTWCADHYGDLMPKARLELLGTGPPAPG